MTNTELSDAPEGVAIVGMAGRFPKAANIAQFWRNLLDGVETTTFFTDEELLAAGVDHQRLNQSDYVKARAILEQAEWFDASFFGFSHREAEIIDPQHRIFLECAWATLEDAGYDPEAYEGLIGVYGGTSMNTYLLNNLATNPELLELIGSYQTMLGNDKDFLTTRVSYKLNLKGPSVNVQTACSTSLVAVTLACQSLLDYQCDMALAGGVSVMFPQVSGYPYREGGIHSPDGRCRAFDSNAQGMFAGQGVGIVALKRLEDALEDGDHIYAVIKGAAMNNDGSMKVGYTAPSVDGQAEAISMAQAMAEVDPETITYIEAHGTATPLGDPIEVAALTQAFHAETEATNYCAIGSVKTNIGHLDAAAGVAGLIKTALALEHKLIPPSLHYEQPNPQIDFDNSPFYVNASLSEWETGETPRRAGVSSFGIGGTNAHAVLEEAPLTESADSAKPWHLLTLSARTETALQTMTENLAAHLRENPSLNMADVAFTLQNGRRAFQYRRIVVCSDAEDAANALETLDAERLFTYHQQARGTAVPTAFMFTGQGAQYVNMALELYQTEPVFRQHVDECADFLKPHLGLDLRNILYPPEGQADAATQQLRQTNLTQPALFVIEYALAQLWMAWGVQPQAMIGHSIGEYVAACLAGVFSLEDALTLVAARGRLMYEMPEGAMLTIHLTEEKVRPLLDGDLSLAVVNGPSLCVVSGPTEAIDALQSQLADQEIDHRRLHTSHAFHSTMMAPALEPFEAQVRRITLNPPQIPFVSNVSGTWITAEEATDPGYWAKHLRQTVRFGEGVAELLKRPDWILLEVGPGRALSTFARQHPDKNIQQMVLTSLRHPREQQSDVVFLLNTLGRLWFGGSPVAWPQLYAEEQRYRVSLPTYPFERQRYWIEPRKRTAVSQLEPQGLSKKPDMADWFYAPVWKHQELNGNTVNDQEQSWLIFLDNLQVGDKIAKQLSQKGQSVIRVQQGAAFGQIDENSYAINVQSGADYDALFNELKITNRLPDKIVHLWNLTDDEGGWTLDGREEEIQNLGFYSLLYLAQALGRQNVSDPIEIQIVSNGLQSVTGQESLQPEKATLLGPCRVIPQEYANVTCRSVDVVWPASKREQDNLHDQLLAELTAASPDAIIAYRGSQRWTLTMDVAPLDDAAETIPSLRKEGVYLITGGTGGIGLALADYLAQTVQAKLTLTGRSALPDRDEWDQWLETHNADDRTSEKIRKVQALEALGAEVIVVSADAANLEQMQAAVAQTRARFGPIHGVIHAAGVAGGGMIQLKTRETAVPVLSPKVQGTRVLDTVLDGDDLELFVLCSSVNSMLPAFGQADYCGANAFLDAFAHAYQARNGATCISINWDTWQEVGMAVQTDVPAQLRKHRDENLRHGLSTREGQAVFARILSHPQPQALISTRDFMALAKQNQERTTFNSLEELEQSLFADAERTEQAASSTTYSRPNLQTAYVAPRNELEQKIVNIWQELLGVDQIGVHDNFFDLGGSSLLALRLFAQIEKISGQKLPLATLFEATTVAQLADMLGNDEVQTVSVSWSPLVPIQTGGSKPPFFFVHAAGGNVLVYRDLARHLGPDQPVYGLQAQGMDGGQPLLTTIEEMASMYLEGIQSVQPDGPYLLGGYCMGGTVALEIAQQLQTQGKEVTLLSLFETYNWENIKNQSKSDYAVFFFQKLVFHWRNFRLLNNQEKQLFLSEKWEVAKRRTKVWRGMFLSRFGRQSDDDDGQSLRSGQIWDTNDRAALDYRPVPYPGHITHFRPVKEYARHEEPGMGWDEMAGKGVTTCELPVYPAAMLVEPFVRETAVILNKYIDEALESTSTVKS